MLAVLPTLRLLLVLVAPLHVVGEVSKLRGLLRQDRPLQPAAPPLGPGTVLFVAGLEETGHHLVQSVLQHLPGVYRYNDGWKLGSKLEPALWRACTTGMPPLSQEQLAQVRSEVLSDIAMCVSTNTTATSEEYLLLLNADGFMASYPDRRLTDVSWWQVGGRNVRRSPNATCLQEIFAGTSLDFKVLQLDRSLQRLIEHGQHFDEGNVTLHAHVLTEHGSFLADQLESIPDRQRMCLHLEDADMQGGQLEAFLAMPGVKNELLKKYSKKRATAEHRGRPGSIYRPAKWTVPQETQDMADRLSKLCRHALSLWDESAEHQ